MMRKCVSLMCLWAVMLLLTACNDGSCYDNGNSLPLMRFYMKGSNTNVTVSGVSLRGVGAPGDSVYVSNQAISEAYLPLRATKTSTQWVISVNTNVNVVVSDTLTIDYTSSPYFASAECGAMYKFNINGVAATHNIIDSIALVQPVVTNVNVESLRVYFKKN